MPDLQSDNYRPWYSLEVHKPDEGQLIVWRFNSEFDNPSKCSGPIKFYSRGSLWIHCKQSVDWAPYFAAGAAPTIEAAPMKTTVRVVRASDGFDLEHDTNDALKELEGNGAVITDIKLSGYQYGLVHTIVYKIPVTTISEMPH